MYHQSINDNNTNTMKLSNRHQADIHPSRINHQNHHSNSKNDNNNNNNNSQNSNNHQSRSIKFSKRKHKSKRLHHSDANNLLKNDFNLKNIKLDEQMMIQNSHLSSSNFKFDANPKNYQHFKMPVLTSIELINSDLNSSNSNKLDNKENLLFHDYVLLPSLTKYKHLIHTVFDQVQLNDKPNYKIVDGKLRVWHKF